MDKSILNPYIYGRAVRPEEFVGRDSEINQICERLYKSQSTVVNGLPHVGKTSLLNYIMNRESRAMHSRCDGVDRNIYRILDAHMLHSIVSQAEFWDYALSPFNESIEGGDYPQLTALLPFFHTARTNHFQSYVLEQFFGAFEKQNLKFTLILDEFDDLLSHPVLNSAEFYGSLRSLASRSMGLGLILGSRRDADTLNRMTQTINPHGSPYFNIFTQITLNAFSEEAFDEIISLSEGRFKPKDVKFIQAVSGRYPFLVQAASAKLWEADDRGLHGYSRYEFAGNELYKESRQHFADTWRVWTNEVRRAITIVALNQIPRLLESHTFAIESNTHTLADYSPELDMLRDFGVLEQQEDNWRISQGAFLWWLTDELKRYVRDESDFRSWLVAQEMDGLFTKQQKEHLSLAASNVLTQVSRGAGTLIESVAKGASSSILKQMGLG